MEIIPSDLFERGRIKDSVLATGGLSFSSTHSTAAISGLWAKTMDISPLEFGPLAQAGEMQPHQMQGLESTVEQKSEFKELRKLHFDAFLFTSAVVFLAGYKTAARQAASDFYRSRILMRGLSSTPSA